MYHISFHGALHHFLAQTSIFDPVPSFPSFDHYHVPESNISHLIYMALVDFPWAFLCKSPSSCISKQLASARILFARSVLFIDNVLEERKRRKRRIPLTRYSRTWASIEGLSVIISPLAVMHIRGKW
jgi:hypothetical protein